jgi:hypothetical protein
VAERLLRHNFFLACNIPNVFPVLHINQYPQRAEPKPLNPVPFRPGPKEVPVADLTAIFFILLIIGVAYPALLTAWWLLFPATVERARLRLERTPWQSFWLGGVLTAAFVIPTAILLALPFGPAKFMAWIVIAVALALSGIGAAGLAARMGERLDRLGNFSAAGAFVRGAIVLELASFFPVVGWFVLFPLATVTALGASAFAILHWVPKSSVLTESAAARA